MTERRRRNVSGSQSDSALASAKGPASPKAAKDGGGSAGKNGSALQTIHDQRDEDEVDLLDDRPRWRRLSNAGCGPEALIMREESSRRFKLGWLGIGLLLMLLTLLSLSLHLALEFSG